MRKVEQEVRNPEEIMDILRRCDVIRVAFNGEPYPYVVPLSFGYEVRDGKPVLYVHGAKEGMKQEFLAKDSHVCVEADILHGYRDKGPMTTADYESLIGFGRAEVVEGAQAVKGVELIMAHCGRPDFDGNKCVMLGMVRILRVTLESVTGKKRFYAEGSLDGWSEPYFPKSSR